MAANNISKHQIIRNPDTLMKENTTTYSLAKGISQSLIKPLDAAARLQEMQGLGTCQMALEACIHQNPGCRELRGLSGPGLVSNSH